MRQVAWTPLPPSNPPRPPTWLGLTAFPIFSSPVFFWFQIIFKTKEAKYKEIVLHMISRCWVACTWPRLDLRGKRVFEADKCFVCVSHWSFVPSLGDRRHNVEWSGGTAASSEERKVKAMQPLWKCNLSSSSNLKTHVKRERGAFPIGLLSKARMTAVTHCEVLGRGSLTLSTSTSTPLDFTNSTFHSFPRPKSAAVVKSTTYL